MAQAITISRLGAKSRSSHTVSQAPVPPTYFQRLDPNYFLNTAASRFDAQKHPHTIQLCFKFALERAIARL
jgi:hypothetical protein